MSYLRPSSRPPTAHSPVRQNLHPRFSVISLGRAIVILYLITLVAAVISARSRTENDLGQPGVQGTEAQETAPHIAGG